jgi:dihydrodipicolinate synthase/N-acetylneuraminate lyase
MASDTNKLPRGLICPLVTPLKPGDLLDVTALDRLIDHVGAGADALLLGDVFWGEGLGLSGETRLEMASAALEIIQGKWPVLITITSHSSKATRDLMARTEYFIERSGYPGRVFWVDYPIYYHSNRGMPHLYDSMASDTSVSFILGNHPGLVERRKKPVKHKHIRTSVLKKVSEIKKVRGVIFSGSLKRSMNYQKAVRHRRDFRFFDGDEVTFMSQPSSNGVVAGGANLLPLAWREITWSCLHRHDVQQQYADHTTQILEAGIMLREFYQLYSQNPAALIKSMLHVAGVLPNAHIASTTQPFTAKQNRAVEALCRQYDLVG